MRVLRFGLAAALTVAVAGIAEAQFTAGNVVAYQVGDGKATLTNTGNSVYLTELNQSGGVVQTTGSLSGVFASGTATSEGLLTLSADTRYLALTGYSSTSTSGSLANTTGTAVPRVVGRVDANQALSTFTLTDFASGNNPRSAVTSNGTDFWLAGGAGGVRHTAFGAGSSTQLSTTVANIRQVNIFNNQLYNSTSSGSAVRVGTVGTGLPTTSGQTITNLPGFPTSGSPYSFFLARLGTAGTGYDTLYVADDSTGAGIQKYSLVNGNWTLNGTLTGATAVRGLAGLVTGDGQVTLYGTSGPSAAGNPSNFYTVTDSSGYNAAPSGTVNTVTTENNIAYRGVAFAPARLEWNGGASGTWNLTSANFTNTLPSTPQASAFFNAYAANFNDLTGVATSTVAIGTGINPTATFVGGISNGVGVRVTNTTTNYVFTGNPIQGVGALLKEGTGTLTIQNANAYSGGTVVNGGTLVVANTAGSATGGGSVTVNSGGTLAGNGFIAPLGKFGNTTFGVTVNTGGTLRPGDAGQQLTVGSPGLENPVTLNAGSTLGIRVNAAGGTAAEGSGGSSTGSNNNQLVVLGTGNLTIDPAATFDIDGTGAGFVVGQTYSYKIAQGPNSQAGLNITDQSLFDAVGFTASDFKLSITGDANGAVFLNVAPVPEPGAVLGLASGALGMGWLVRRARRPAPAAACAG